MRGFLGMLFFPMKANADTGVSLDGGVLLTMKTRESVSDGLGMRGLDFPMQTDVAMGMGMDSGASLFPMRTDGSAETGLGMVALVLPRNMNGGGRVSRPPLPHENERGHEHETA
jgi:hypothetical protein